MGQKPDFVRKLQNDKKAFAAFEISQKIRLEIGCVSICQLDSELSAEEFRGYMLKYSDKPDRSPENPELYICVVSAQQSQAWQQVVWIKENLQILDEKEQRTDSSDKLARMLDNRRVHTPNEDDLPANVRADKNGFILALGVAIPLGYREILREQRYLERFSKEEIEHILMIPQEFVEFVLDPSFENHFNRALEESD